MGAVSQQLKGANWWRVATFLVVGYLCLGRSFSYLGVSYLNIFVGEIVLGVFLLVRGVANLVVLERLGGCSRGRMFMWLGFWSIVYGLIQVLRGVANGFGGVVALRDWAFNYYILFFLLGLVAAGRDSGAVFRTLSLFVKINGIYGTAFFVFLDDLNRRYGWSVPGTSHLNPPVPLFGGPSYGSAFSGPVVAILATVVYWSRFSIPGIWLALNTFVLLASLVRGAWLALVIGLVVLYYCQRSWRAILRRMVYALLVVGAVGLMGLRVVTARGSVSLGSVVARVLAPISVERAVSYASAAEVNTYYGTAEWRALWWAELWRFVHRSLRTSVFGLGYGYPIGNLHPLLRAGEFIQTPHNSVLYALAFEGWLGVVIFLMVQLSLFRLICIAEGETRAMALAVCIGLFCGSLFEPFFEQPHNAIPYYVIAGMSVGPWLRGPIRRRLTRQGIRVGD
jgi:hypothetical protein